MKEFSESLLYVIPQSLLPVRSRRHVHAALDLLFILFYKEQESSTFTAFFYSHGLLTVGTLAFQTWLLSKRSTFMRADVITSLPVFRLLHNLSALIKDIVSKIPFVEFCLIHY